MYGCQQTLIHAPPDVQAIIEYLCTESNKVWNCSVYYARQIYFKTGKVIKRAEICAEMFRSKNKHFGAMYVSSAQQTCNNVAEAFKSFQELTKLWKRGELPDKPSLPKYRKTGLFTVTYPKRWLKLTDDGIRIPLGNQVKTWFGVDAIYLPMPSNLKWEDIKELRILPRNRCFYAEFVYPTEDVKSQLNKSRVLGIDHGIDNWLTCVSNVGTSFIIDGKHLKSLNQWYNKRVATLKENKEQGFWSKQLATITEKRNRQMRDAVNKAARLVINHCLENSIGRIVFGWNQRQKDSANMGRKANQKFVQIPTAKLKERIFQLSQQYGIDFVETEEANTSAASFVDSDSLPKYGEKPEDWKSSGKRVKRGLFRTASNWYINADANGAANIISKVAATLGINLSGVSRGALTTPLRVHLWTLKNPPTFCLNERSEI
ncbi:transposase, IS605 OrfB family, central region [Nostoc sp. PCC 7524]|uniref:RNA-guided endonuclease InsQ/TnpB family protein n=1 Tax=Nostoc sp. (strain ATCC 29411 / PCC 7524) TaxID=28072 RepID=UPI00029F41A3|nr:RNA-guided endonuclease TnpB family protein [Nostoc sp. PCC 7524]AFY50165.1 transposase, IS605 OrfB family, central region [Nostoc sp. PCC 7524]